MSEILKELAKYPVATRLSLNGTIIVGRDIAHAKLKERLDRGEDLPQYIKDHPIYYAGPAKTPDGMACGSMGPTTAGRMDSYVELFQSHGGSMVMLAKGNRSQQVTDACKKYGGFYLGSIGGPAAILAQNNIKSIECVEYPELGMEAIWKIEVEDFPAFILVDDKGNDFFRHPFFTNFSFFLITNYYETTDNPELNNPKNQHIVWLDVVRLCHVYSFCCHCTDPFQLLSGHSSQY